MLEILILRLKAIDITLTLIFVVLCFIWLTTCSVQTSLERIADEVQKGRYTVERARTP